MPLNNNVLEEMIQKIKTKEKKNQHVIIFNLIILIFLS